MSDLYKKLTMIQTELKAPKNLYNSYGGFKYRNLEGICEAVKPLLEQHGCYLRIHDEVVLIGERYYVKAVVTFGDAEASTEITSTAFARESETKKGMDGSQITGTASSYARKYAMNGLFLIDDTKDPDTDEYQKQTRKSNVQDDFNSRIASDSEVQALRNLLKRSNISEKAALAKVGLKDFSSVNAEQYNTMVRWAQGDGDNR